MSEHKSKPISSGDVAWTEWSEVPRFATRWRHLSGAALGKDYKIGIAIEELPPGKQTSPAHYHIFEEEHVYVLEGTMSLRLGAETHALKAGDYVCFPAGQKAGHCLINAGDAPCRYLIIGENNPREVVVYTDSQHVLTRALGRRAIFDINATRHYWDGEDTGLPAGAALPDGGAPGLDAAAGKPLAPIASDAVGWDDEGEEGTPFGGRSKHLTFAATGGPDYRVGVLMESPAPGKRLCPRHYHLLEEEHAFILEGEVTLLLGEERHVMRAGDYVCFPAGQEIGHSFLNSGAGSCRYLMIGERNPADVCLFPDSNKIVVRALKERDVLDRGAVKKYFDGEI